MNENIEKTARESEYWSAALRGAALRDPERTRSGAHQVSRSATRSGAPQMAGARPGARPGAQLALQRSGRYKILRTICQKFRTSRKL